MAQTYGHRRQTPSMIKFADLERAMRRPGPPNPGQNAHHPQLANPQQIAMQQAIDAQKREAIKRQSKIPTDKEIPDGVQDLVLGDAVQCYRSLREVEKKLDATMMRKRLDTQDSQNHMYKKQRTLRVWVSNTVDNQPWQQTGMDAEAFDFGDTSSQATYRVKIEGRLLDDDDEFDKESEEKVAEEDDDAMEQDGAPTPAKKSTFTPPQSRTKFSHFFKQMTVEFDREPTLQPDGVAQVEWRKPAPPPGGNPLNPSDQANFDSLEFERKGDENMNITINLFRDEPLERFQLSRPMADLLDRAVDDRAGVLMGIWTYIRSQKLYEDEDMRRARCDAKLRTVFSTDTLFIVKIPELINDHLQPLPPIKLAYTIRTDQAFFQSQSPSSTPSPQPTVYDVTILTDDPLRSATNHFLTSATTQSNISLQQLAQLDDKIALAVQAMQHSKAKHAFLNSMSQDPVSFVKRWTSSQRRDLEVILGEASRGQDESGYGEEWRKGGKDGIWGGEVARESVGLLLARQRMAP